MRRDAQAVLLLLVGATLLKIGIAGTYVRYVKAGQLPLLLAAGAVLVGVAGVTLYRSIVTPRPAGTAPDDDGDRPGTGPAPVEGATIDPAPVHRTIAGTDSGAHRPVSLASVHADDDGFTGDVGAPTALAAPTVLVPALSPAARAGSPAPVSPAPVSSAPVSSAPVSSAPVSSAPVSPGSRRAPAPTQFPPRGAGRGRAVRSARPAHDEPRVGWLLLIPALALLMFAPPAVGSYQAARNGTALGSRAASDFPPLAAGDPVPVTLLDYAGRAVFDQGHSLTGRRVLLTGFIIPGPNGRPYLTRMVVSCCAADARPIKIGLTGEVPPGLTQEQWVQVEGVYTDQRDRDPVNGETIPYVRVSQVRTIPVPQEQYE